MGVHVHARTCMFAHNTECVMRCTCRLPYLVAFCRLETEYGQAQPPSENRCQVREGGRERGREGGRKDERKKRREEGREGGREGEPKEEKD